MVVVPGDFNDYSKFEKRLDEYLQNIKPEETELVYGDRLYDVQVERYAKERNIATKVMPGNSVNTLVEMTEYASSGGAGAKKNNGALVVFWDGESESIRNLIKSAQKKNLQIDVALHASNTTTPKKPAVQNAAAKKGDTPAHDEPEL